MKRKLIYLASLLVATCMVLAASCSTPPVAAPVDDTPTPTSRPTATQTPLPNPTLIAFTILEKEIVDFVLNSFYQKYRLAIEQGFDHVLSVNNLIVWQTLKKPAEDSPNDYSNPEAPIQVWLLANGEMTEVIDKQNAIQRYKTESRQADAGTPSASPWFYTGFGIISISDDGKEAKLFVDESCAGSGICGIEYIDTLQRSEQGVWTVINHEIVLYH